VRALDLDAARTRPLPPIEYERDLVEEAVLLAVAGRDAEAEFRAGRDATYAVAEPDEREARFAELHAEWFASLDLGRPVRLALDELPVLADRARAAMVGRARSRREEGADLLVPRGAADLHSRIVADARGADGSPTVAIRLRPDRFRDPGALLAFLRRELLFVADMLDPEFGYTPDLPANLVESAPRRLLEERYRFLWETWVAGRLAVRGLASRDEAEARLMAVTGTLPALARSDPEGIAALAAGRPATHLRLLAMVSASLAAHGA
jgi:hypothetical protein